MKKVITLILASILTLSILTSCSSKEDKKGDDTTIPVTTAEETTIEENNDTEPSLELSELATKIEEIYAIKKPEFMIGTRDIELTDLDALKYNTGLASADKIKAAAVSEAMIGSQAYSLAIVRLNDKADATAVAEEMKSGIDQRKWVCVEADDLRVVAYDDIVMLIMVSTELSDTITANDIVASFTQVCGTPTVDLK